MEAKRLFYFRFSHRDTAEDKLGYRRYMAMGKKFGCRDEEILSDFDSGKNPKRPDYLKLVEGIKSGATEIGTPNLLRLNRNIIEAEKFKELVKQNKTLIYIAESGEWLDLTNSSHSKQYDISNLFGKWELEATSDRYSRSWDDLRDRRYSVKTPFGWTTDRISRKPIPDRTKVICLLETQEEFSYAQILNEAIDRFIDCGSTRRVVSEIHAKFGVQRFNSENLIDNNQRRRRLRNLNPYLNNPHRGRKSLFLCASTLTKILRNPILIGTLVYLAGTDREEVYPNNHEPLISVAKFRKIDRIMAGKTNPHLAQTAKAKYPLAGLVFCGHCGGSCYSRKRGKRNNKECSYYYFACKNITHGCCAKPIRFERIDEAVVSNLTEKYKQITQRAITPAEQVESAELIEVKTKLAALSNLPINCIDRHIQKSIAELEQQIIDLKTGKQDKVKADKPKIALLESVFANPLYWETLEMAERREIYHQLVRRAVIMIEDLAVEKKKQKAIVKRIDLFI